MYQAEFIPENATLSLFKSISLEVNKSDYISYLKNCGQEISRYWLQYVADTDITLEHALRSLKLGLLNHPHLTNFYIKNNSNRLDYVMENNGSQKSNDYLDISFELITVFSFISFVEYVMGKPWKPQATTFSFPECIYSEIVTSYIGSNTVYSNNNTSIKILDIDAKSNINFCSLSSNRLSSVRRQSIDPASPFSTSLILGLEAYVGTIKLEINYISEIICIAPRTLQRRLTQEGTSFREIRDYLHIKFANHLLSEGVHSATEIASLLDYSDLSHFSRAFKRVTGHSPSEQTTETPPFTVNRQHLHSSD